MKKHLTIRLEEQKIKELKLYCIEHETSITDLITTCIENKLKEEGKMKTWERNGYTVEEREFDYNLHRLSVLVDGVELYQIIPDDIDIMKDMIEELDNGASVIGWETGTGETVELPIYLLETEDPAKIALGDFNMATLFRTYSRKEAEKLFETIIYDKGLTLVLSKVTSLETECLAERKA